MPSSASLRNRFNVSSPARFFDSKPEAIVAKVYKTPSWLDNKECIVLDYAETSLVAHYIRDEIRLIGPGFYLGKVYWGKDRLIDFCQALPPTPTAVAHPCDESSLQGAVDAAKLGLIAPILVGPKEKIEAVA